MDKVRIIKEGGLISQSKSLRGVLDYARVSPVKSVLMRKVREADGYRVTFRFVDDARCSVHFQSLFVAADWVLKRRSWNKPVKFMESETLAFFSWMYPGKYSPWLGSPLEGLGIREKLG